MSAPILEILAPLRTAIVNTSSITSKLGLYKTSPSVHTRRPVPPEAKYPMVLIGPMVARNDQDGINYFAPVAILDLMVYGTQKDHYRKVEQVSELLYQLFHRQRGAITVEDYSVTDLRCSGPSPAPVDDDTLVGRRVSLTARLFARG